MMRKPLSKVDKKEEEREEKENTEEAEYQFPSSLDVSNERAWNTPALRGLSPGQSIKFSTKIPEPIFYSEEEDDEWIVDDEDEEEEDDEDEEY